MTNTIEVPISLIKAGDIAAIRDHPGQETRIVRRMVSQPEVMEE
ncbi:hypothetical protein [Corynebacterium striatum]|nr:hypothetical protein [Corynebacterium striatum]